MKLLIVESPNKIRKIKAILGAGWEIAASVGHIRDLPTKDLGVERPEYRPQYELTGRGGEVVRKLRALAVKADEVYLATDPDREGEAIAWHLEQALKLRSPRRVRFDAITPEVIRRAVAAPARIDPALVQAQEARRVLDRLVGYQVSPVLSRETARRGLSAGRVQSPALRLVVEREREIQAFRETRHFGAELSFDGNSWRAQWETAPFLPKGLAEDDPAGKYILDEALAARAAACRDCTVLSSANRSVREGPPPPFTTSTMLQAASVRLRWRPETTAAVAQRLFEAGLITYHRTDSQNLSGEAVGELRSWAAERGLPLPAAARHFRSKSNAQEAHEAVRPTHFADEQAGEDREQQQLYRLIWERAVASQLADAVWSVNTTRLEAACPLQAPAGAPAHWPAKFTFKAEGRVLVEKGWRSLTARDQAEEDEDEEGANGGRVPVLPVGARATAESGRVLAKKTQPPPRYTQATLIKRLEALGIGRPSTYAAILKNVLTRGYMSEEKRTLRPTELGFVVIDALSSRFSFAEYAFTRELEAQLDEIAEGRAEYLPVVRAADEQLQKELGAAAALAVRRPAFAPGAAPKTSWASRGSASGETRGRLPRRSTPAPAADQDQSQDQSQTPKKTATKKAAGAKRAAAPAKKLAGARAKKRTKAPTTGTVTNSKSGTANPASPAATDPSTAPPCPLCRAGFVRLAREDAKFYGCSNYPACRFVVWRTVASRALSPAEVDALVREGRTAVLKGFTSKTGRPFDASLTLNAEGKTEFSFPPRS